MQKTERASKFDPKAMEVKHAKINMWDSNMEKNLTELWQDNTSL